MKGNDLSCHGICLSAELMMSASNVRMTFPGNQVLTRMSYDMPFKSCKPRSLVYLSDAQELLNEWCPREDLQPLNRIIMRNYAKLRNPSIITALKWPMSCYFTRRAVTPCAKLWIPDCEIWSRWNSVSPSKSLLDAHRISRSWGILRGFGWFLDVFGTNASWTLKDCCRALHNSGCLFSDLLDPAFGAEKMGPWWCNGPMGSVWWQWNFGGHQNLGIP